MLTHRAATVLGDIPSDWGRDLLRNFLEEQRGGDWGADDGEEALRILRSTNFTDCGDLNFSEVAVRYFSTVKASAFGLRSGDLLVERSGGGPTQPVGRVGFVADDLPGFWFSNFVQLLRADDRKINPQYLSWLLLELHQSGIIERLQHQTTQMRNLDYRDYLRVYLPQPSRPEQETIVRALAACSNCVTLASKKLGTARRLKIALMQQLFKTGLPGRHHQFKETTLGEVPSAWDVVKLKKCGEWGSGGTPDRGNPNYWGGTIPWVKSGEVDYRPIKKTEEHITEAGAASISGALLTRGTLLVAMYGAGVTRGKAALLDVEAYINQAIAFFRGDESTLNEWLLYWFERNYEFVRTFAGGANQDNLSLYLVKNLEIARPQPDEQDLIASILREASAMVDSLTEEISGLQRLRRSLLRSLVTGRVRVRI